MDQATFAKTWHYKIVVPRLGGAFANFPIKHYLVSAALYNFDERGSVISLYAIDYNEQNNHWFTVHIKEEDLDNTMMGLELIESEQAEVVSTLYRDTVKNLMNEYTSNGENGKSDE